jgi:hypothetical protein
MNSPAPLQAYVAGLPTLAILLIAACSEPKSLDVPCTGNAPFGVCIPPLPDDFGSNVHLPVTLTLSDTVLQLDSIRPAAELRATVADGHGHLLAQVDSSERLVWTDAAGNVAAEVSESSFTFQVQWASSDTQVAEVPAKGWAITVKARGPGETVVRAIAMNCATTCGESDATGSASVRVATPLPPTATSTEGSSTGLTWRSPSAVEAQQRHPLSPGVP